MFALDNTWSALVRRWNDRNSFNYWQSHIISVAALKLTEAWVTLLCNNQKKNPSSPRLITCMLAQRDVRRLQRKQQLSSYKFNLPLMWKRAAEHGLCPDSPQKARMSLSSPANEVFVRKASPLRTEIERRLDQSATTKRRAFASEGQSEELKGQLPFPFFKCGGMEK